MNDEKFDVLTKHSKKPFIHKQKKRTNNPEEDQKVRFKEEKKRQKTNNWKQYLNYEEDE